MVDTGVNNSNGSSDNSSIDNENTNLNKIIDQKMNEDSDITSSNLAQDKEKARDNVSAQTSGAEVHNDLTDKSDLHGQQSTDFKKTIKIEFQGSDVIRSKFPMPFDVAEKVAEDWLNNGNFEKIPVGHPLAQYFVGEGLRKAKEVEKKLDEAGYIDLAKENIEKVATQAFMTAMKVNNSREQVKENLKSKVDLIKSIVGFKK